MTYNVLRKHNLQEKQEPSAECNINNMNGVQTTRSTNLHQSYLSLTNKKNNKKNNALKFPSQKYENPGRTLDNRWPRFTSRERKKVFSGWSPQGVSGGFSWEITWCFFSMKEMMNPPVLEWYMIYLKDNSMIQENRFVETKQIRIWNVMFSFTFRNYGQLDELIGNSSRVKSGGFSYLHFVVSWKLDFQFCGFFGWLLGTVSNNSVMSNKTKERAGLNMYKYGICNCSDLFWWSLLLSLDGFSTNVPTRVYPPLNIPPRFLIRGFHWFPNIFQGFMFKHVFFPTQGCSFPFQIYYHVLIWHLEQKSTWEVSEKIKRFENMLQPSVGPTSRLFPGPLWKKHGHHLFCSHPPIGSPDIWTECLKVWDLIVPLGFFVWQNPILRRDMSL